MLLFNLIFIVLSLWKFLKMSLILKLVNGMKSGYTNPQEKEGKQSVNNVCWYEVKQKLAIYKWSMEYFCSLRQDTQHD